MGKSRRMRKTKDWEVYERFVAHLMMLNLSTDWCVTPNARLQGRVSGGSRQLDVLIDARHTRDDSRRIIVDAKRRKRKIDVTHVEAFLGLMEDVGATHGYLVCPAVHTDAALQLAQQTVSICLIPLTWLAGFDPSCWPQCDDRSCRHGRVFGDGFPEITLTVQAVEKPHVTPHVPYVHYVGKCDQCGRFHVKCMTCDKLLPLNERDGQHRGECACP